jgi:hypothetical protein
MTPERWTALAALLLEARDWVADQDPGSLNAALLDAAVDACRDERRRQVKEGAK